LIDEANIALAKNEETDVEVDIMMAKLKDMSEDSEIKQKEIISPSFELNQIELVYSKVPEFKATWKLNRYNKRFDNEIFQREYLDYIQSEGAEPLSDFEEG